MLQPKQKTVFVCDVCGEENPVNRTLNPCNMNKPLDVVDLKVNDEVQLYAPQWHKRDEPLKLQSYGICNIHYSRPGEKIYPNWLSMYSDELPIHTMVITLAQSFCSENGQRKWRAWKQGEHSCSLISVTYQDFLLWKEGDRTKLEAAGMLPKNQSWLQKIGNWLDLGIRK